MVEIREPVPSDVLRGELGDATRIALFRDVEVHLFAAHEAPQTMQEIGRIRELLYREVGAGRNVAADIDSRDLEWPWYSQMVSFDREHGEIVAMYRLIHCGWAIRHAGAHALRTSTLFRFSERFQVEQLPFLCELGRSVVNRYAVRAVQGLFSVWTGLGALIREWPDLHGFFGNVSVYGDVSEHQLSLLLSYLYARHGDSDNRVTVRDDKHGVAWEAQLPAPSSLEELLECASRENFTVPPILVSYLKASPALVAFDTAIDPDFGDAREIAILVPTRGLTTKMRRRIVDPYESRNPGRFVLPERAQI